MGAKAIFIEAQTYALDFYKKFKVINIIGSIDNLIEHKINILTKLEEFECSIYLKENLNEDKSLLSKIIGVETLSFIIIKYSILFNMCYI